MTSSMPCLTCRVLGSWSTHTMKTIHIFINKTKLFIFLNSFICTVCSFLHQRVWLDLRHFLKILMTVYNKEYISIKNTNQPLLVFIPGTFYPRKQEAVRKTTPELLSAVLRSLLCGCVCVHFTSILCTLYSRVGQFFRF